MKNHDELKAAYEAMNHAKAEYRTWKENMYIGSNMGDEGRSIYIHMLRNRACAAILEYRRLRNKNTNSRTHFKVA